ncbi:MAG: recombinase RecT [Synechococcaceae cyanobacterium]|nr:recombinase RecT [Synechococcaceae cyanobacterium]
MSDTPSRAAEAATPSPAALAVRGEGLQVFGGIDAFDAAQRMARALCSSTLVPKEYQGQNGLANSLIALEIAGRMGLSPLVVMQNMTPIHGRPTWSSRFLIATVNASGRFTPPRFVFDDKENPTSCTAVATDRASGEVLEGETITLDLARREGWYGRNGSKWQTMPGQMLRYRAASWWANVYCPEIALGLMTQEEAIDIEPIRVEEQAPPATPLSPHPVATAGVVSTAPAAFPHRESSRPRRQARKAAHPALAEGAPTPEQPVSGAPPADPAVTPAASPGDTAPADPETPQGDLPVPASPPAERAPDGTAPAPPATAGDLIGAGLRQIPRLSSLAELDQAEGRINRLLAAGEINDSQAERLWAAIEKRRTQLQQAAGEGTP